MANNQSPRNTFRKALNVVVIGVVLLVLAGVFFGKTCPLDCPRRGKASIAIQRSRNIGLCLYQYAGDHSGRYPEGKTSSEVFQHLIDEKYASDPALFYIEIPGKVKPTGDQLKSINVSFDITCCVDSTTPDNLPIVYTTGYTVTYKAGSAAIPIHSTPTMKPVNNTWSQWWNSNEETEIPFIAASYKDNSARIKTGNVDGSIPDFIPSDFNPKGKTYRQLTP